MVKEIICKTDGAVILVDDEDYPILSRFPWYRGGKDEGHPMTFIYGKNDTSVTVYMHQIIMGGAVGTDHHDGNRYNMQKSNLRPATYSQNGANSRKMQIRKGKPTSSIYKGVFFDKKTGKFRAGAVKDKKRYDCGTFVHEDDAGRAYNEMALKLHGPYARLNEIN